MIPFLTNPLALLALLSIPALIVIYRLRRRVQQRLVVSSLMFWPIDKEPQDGGRRFQRLRTPFFFFLELLILLLLCMAAVGPQCSSQQAKPALFLVLDDSYSMRAYEPHSPRQRAMAQILRETRWNAFRFIRVILAQDKPQLLGGFVTSQAQLSLLLRQWRCGSATADVEKAVAFVLKLADPQARVLVLSDHAPRTKIQEGRLRWLAVGKAQPNVAITHASRSRSEGKDWGLVMVSNFSNQAQSIPLQIRDVTTQRLIKRTVLHLRPSETSRLTFSLPLSSSTWEFSVPADGLGIDNQVQLLPSTRKPVRVKFAWTEPTWQESVEKAVLSTKQVLRTEQQPELIITDRPTVLPASSSAWVFSLHRGSGQTKAYVGPYVLQREHPMLQGISLQGVIWSVRQQAILPGQPLVLVGEIPLLVETSTLGQGRSFALSLDPDTSTLGRTPNWPVLFWNLIAWKQQEQPGLLEPNVRLGANAQVRLPAQTQVVQVQPPDPTRPAFTMRKAGQGVIVEARHIGMYRIQTNTNTYSFIVNAVSSDESNLLLATTGEWGQWKPISSQQRHNQDWSWLFALLALVLLAWHTKLLASATRSE